MNLYKLSVKPLERIQQIIYICSTVLNNHKNIMHLELLFFYIRQYNENRIMKTLKRKKISLNEKFKEMEISQ